MDENLPLDELYAQGLPIGDMLFEEMDYSYNLWTDVDWNKPVDAPEAVLKATAYVAVHSHYLKTAHMLLCGKIIQHKPEKATFDTTQIAMMLTAYKLESTYVWGRYLGNIKVDQQISESMKLYLRKLFSDDNTLSIIIGMEILSGPVMQRIYEALQDKGDTLYSEIVDNLIDRRDRERAMLERQLPQAFDHLDPAEKDALREDAKQYWNLAENILLADSSMYAAVDIDVEALQKKMDEDAQTFLEEIGLN